MSFLQVEIRTVDVNGQPTNTIVATSDPIEVSEINRDSFYTFNFSSSVSVVPNLDKYAIVITRDDSILETREIGWIYSNLSNPYIDGSKWNYNGISWSNDSDKDLYFKVFYDAPQEITVNENVWQFNQDYANKFFVSTDNTMELDMRFNMSFCIDGSGSMKWADPYDLRKSETLLFIREVLRRSPFSYVDIWTFNNYITESTYEGPTNQREIYSAALGSITSNGYMSRLWGAAEQAIGNLDSSSIVNAIIRDSFVDETLELMRQMNRIDYEEMEAIDPEYDASTGFSQISNYGAIVDYLINEYASTSCSIGFIISDGYDNDNSDYDIDNIILTANSIRKDYWTPIYCFSIGGDYKNEKMQYVSEQTGGDFYQLGGQAETRMRESFNELLNDKEKTIFQGNYEDEVWFDELTFISEIEIGVIIPPTCDFKFEISISYDGLSFEEWQEIPSNSLETIEKFIMAFKIRMTGWLGNIYGGNYYDIYGLVDSDSLFPDEFSILCHYANYYGYDSYQYYSDNGYYYYRSTEYPSPKVYSLKYWTVDPIIKYRFTEPQEAPVIAEYLLTTSVDLSKKSLINWGIVRGDSTDTDDLVPILTNRMGILPNRKYSVFYTPDVHQIGLSTQPVSQTNNGVLIYKVIDDTGNLVTWEDTDIIVVKVNGYEVDVASMQIQLIGEYGLIHWFGEPRKTTDVVTVDITTPGGAVIKQGEIATTDNRRTYYLNNGPWPWDATVTIRVNDQIRNDGFELYPEDGIVLFLNELGADDVVTAEIKHSDYYRIGYEYRSYTNEDIDDPDFGFIFSKEVETETAALAKLTAPPIVSNVKLTPESPSLTDRIIVTYDYYQEDNNAEQGTTIEWYVMKYGTTTYIHYAPYDNRNVMRASDVPGNNPGSPFGEFDKLYVVVTPKDANNTGIPVTSNSVTFGGYIPPYIIPTVITSKLTVPATIIADENDADLTRDNNNILNAVIQNLVASYTYYDPNTGDDSSDNSTIEWYKNGEGTPSYTSTYPDLTLPLSYLKVGQVWSYVITPYDGNFYGYKVESEEVIITQEKE